MGFLEDISDTFNVFDVTSPVGLVSGIYNMVSGKPNFNRDPNDPNYTINEKGDIAVYDFENGTPVKIITVDKAKETTLNLMDSLFKVAKTRAKIKESAGIDTSNDFKLPIIPTLKDPEIPNPEIPENPENPIDEDNTTRNIIIGLVIVGVISGTIYLMD